MNKYEVMYIVHPDLDEAAFTEVNERVIGWITDGGGTIVKADVWGKRQLAYPIRKKNEGQYVLLSTEMDPTFCITLEREFNIVEPVLRYLITRVD